MSIEIYYYGGITTIQGLPQSYFNPIGIKHLYFIRALSSRYENVAVESSEKGETVGSVIRLEGGKLHAMKVFLTYKDGLALGEKNIRCYWATELGDKFLNPWPVQVLSTLEEVDDKQYVAYWGF
jgi:hypothetical protein